MPLVDNGKIVFEGGFGVREVGKPTPVDANTLFMVASNTKGMTTLLLARLADQKKLRWDQPETEVYPAFRLGKSRGYEAGAGQAPCVRVHRPAASGYGVAVRV